MAAALFLNRNDQRMFLLTLIVGASVFLPVPRDSAYSFYLFCICAELVVGLAAFSLRCRAGDIVTNMGVLLVVAHILGYSLDGSQAFSPYRSIVKILETTQLLACVACSTFFSRILRNREPTTK